jgi:hypothetical protein
MQILTSSFVKNKELPHDLWPESIKGQDQLKVTYYPWYAHAGTEVPHRYQIDIVGKLSKPVNYVDDVSNIKVLDNIVQSSFGQLRGISATGKGTRIYQLISYLMTKYKWTHFYDDKLDSWFNEDYNNQVAEAKANGMSKEDIKNNIKPPKFNQVYVGILFPELNLLVLGARVVKSTKSRLLSLTGCDAINTGYGFTTLIEMTRRYAGKYNVLCEGYVSMNSSDLGIAYQHNFGHKNFFYKCFQHDNKEDMLERFKSRSFHVAKGDAAYSQNEMHGQLSYDALMKDVTQLGDELGRVSVAINDPKEDVAEFGIEYLDFLKLYDDIESFTEYSKHNDVKRDYQFAEKNYDQYWYLYMFQKQNIKKPELDK